MLIGRLQDIEMIPLVNLVAFCFRFIFAKYYCCVIEHSDEIHCVHTYTPHKAQLRTKGSRPDEGQGRQKGWNVIQEGEGHVVGHTTWAEMNSGRKAGLAFSVFW